jgi:hypothetical protein
MPRTSKIDKLLYNKYKFCEFSDIYNFKNEISITVLLFLIFDLFYYIVSKIIYICYEQLIHIYILHMYTRY